MLRKILCLALVICLASSVSYALSKDDRWTMSFDRNSTVSDALRQIENTTGVSLNIRGEADRQIIRHSFLDADIGQILQDVLGNMNYALTWNYSGIQLESVDIWFFDKGAKTGKHSVPRKEENLSQHVSRNMIHSELPEPDEMFSSKRQKRDIPRKTLTQPLNDVIDLENLPEDLPDEVKEHIKMMQERGLRNGGFPMAYKPGDNFPGPVIYNTSDMNPNLPDEVKEHIEMMEREDDDDFPVISKPENSPDDLSEPVIYNTSGMDPEVLRENIRKLKEQAPVLKKTIPNFSCTPSSF